MKKNNNTIIIAILILALFVALGAWSTRIKNKPGDLDTFAMCLADSGAKFYGTFWCPHCNNQKAMFGNSARLLPYIECSTPDGRGQTQECADAGITGYPTWEFADGSRIGGETELSVLSDKTGCVLPQ